MIYFIQQGDYGSIKIGVSNLPSRRLQGLQGATPKILKLIGVMEGDIEKERQLHIQFKSLRQKGEWFYPGPKLMEFIINNTAGENEGKILRKETERKKREKGNEFYSPKEIGERMRKVHKLLIKLNKGEDKPKLETDGEKFYLDFVEDYWIKRMLKERKMEP